MIDLVKELPVTFGPHWADKWMVTVTAVGVVVTGVIAYLTLRANKNAGMAQVRATQAYTAALKATEAASQKQIEALEALVGRINSQQGGGSKPADSKVLWKLSREGRRGRWLLTNSGEETAFATRIDPATDQDAADLFVVHDEPVDVPPGASLPFSIEKSLASPPAALIQVSWNSAEGEPDMVRLVVA